jgi:hypothetical protein
MHAASASIYLLLPVQYRVYYVLSLLSLCLSLRKRETLRENICYYIQYSTIAPFVRRDAQRLRSHYNQLRLLGS